MASIIATLEDALSRRGGEVAADMLKEAFNDPEKDEWHAAWYGFWAGYRATDITQKLDKNNLPDHLPAAAKGACLKEYPWYNTAFNIGWVASDQRVQIGAALLFIAGVIAKYAGWI